MDRENAYVETAYQHALKALLLSEMVSLPCDESEVADDPYSDMEGQPFERYFSTDDIGGELDTFREQLADFVAENWPDVKCIDPAQCGHDFVLTRNGHGAGFWDRGLGDRGDRLTAACKPYGECNLSLSDYDRVELAT